MLSGTAGAKWRPEQAISCIQGHPKRLPVTHTATSSPENSSPRPTSLSPVAMDLPALPPALQQINDKVVEALRTVQPYAKVRARAGRRGCTDVRSCSNNAVAGCMYAVH
jgi:hypothetical protein